MGVNILIQTKKWSTLSRGNFPNHYHCMQAKLISQFLSCTLDGYPLQMLRKKLKNFKSQNYHLPQFQIKVILFHQKDASILIVKGKINKILRVMKQKNIQKVLIGFPINKKIFIANKDWWFLRGRRLVSLKSNDSKPFIILHKISDRKLQVQSFSQSIFSKQKFH